MKTEYGSEKDSRFLILIDEINRDISEEQRMPQGHQKKWLISFQQKYTKYLLKSVILTGLTLIYQWVYNPVLHSPCKKRLEKWKQTDWNSSSNIIHTAHKALTLTTYATIQLPGIQMTRDSRMTVPTMFARINLTTIHNPQQNLTVNLQIKKCVLHKCSLLLSLT